MGQNPPDGAIINYYLKADSAQPIVLEIFDKANKLVRRFSSADKPEIIDENSQAYPSYWFRPPRLLSAKAGMQRWSWDLHYPPPEGARRSYPMTAIYQDTPSEPNGPTVLPGDYTVKLTVGGKSYTQPLTIKLDPRVKTSPEGIAQQFAISMKSYEGTQQIRDTQEQIRNLRAQLKSAKDSAGQGALAEAIAALDKKVAAIEGGGGGGGRFGGSAGQGGAEPSLSRISGELSGLMSLVEGADVTPT
jgi:hypothetical protein